MYITDDFHKHQKTLRQNSSALCRGVKGFFGHFSNEIHNLKIFLSESKYYLKKLYCVIKKFYFFSALYVTRILKYTGCAIEEKA